MAINGRQFAIYLEGAGNLSGVTNVSARRNWGKARVTAGNSRRQSQDPDKWRNGAGRTEPDSGEFTPGLGGLS